MTGIDRAFVAVVPPAEVADALAERVAAARRVDDDRALAVRVAPHARVPRPGRGRRRARGSRRCCRRRPGAGTGAARRRRRVPEAVHAAPSCGSAWSRAPTRSPTWRRPSTAPPDRSGTRPRRGRSTPTSRSPGPAVRGTCARSWRPSARTRRAGLDRRRGRPARERDPPHRRGPHRAGPPPPGRPSEVILDPERVFGYGGARNHKAVTSPLGSRT